MRLCVKCTKFGQLILRIIIKIDAARYQIFRLKCTKIVFGPLAAGGAYIQRSPRPPSWIKGGLLREGDMGREGKGRKRPGEEDMGGEV